VSTAGETPRVGVYVCDCGFNILGVVDVPEVVRYAATLENVVASKEYKYMCSDPGQDLIKKDIREHRLNRVVVASCTPTLHERTFRRVVSDAGLNPFLFNMVNIREGVSWVTDDKKQATEKAKALVRAGVRRVILQEALEPRSEPVDPNVLVIGGGIAGMHAALSLGNANSGAKVHLVEREPSIGGNMARFDKTFPTLDCASCILTPKMTEVKIHPNITLHSYSEVVAVDGYVGNFDIVIEHKPRYVNEDLCIGCLKCVEACVYKDPRFPNAFDLGLAKRKPIYIPFPQAVPTKVLIDPNDCLKLKFGKCKLTCVDACEKDAIDFTQKAERVALKVGSIIVATGFKPFDARRKPQYGYGVFPNVFTALEAERLLSPTGPTEGIPALKNGELPQRVGIIHCVGSRDKNTNAYCSKVCCMYSLKLAHLIRERTGADVYNFYIDMRTPGKGYEEFYDRLLSEGLKVIRGRVAEVTKAALTKAEKDHLIIRVEDTLAGMVRRIPVDMVILSVGLEPQADTQELRRMLNLSCGREGFLQELHPKLAPVATATDGIYIAGACQGPKDIPETVAQAGSAASEALALVHRGKVEIQPYSAVVDEALCSGCKVCIGLCPYDAISYDEEKKVVHVLEVKCKGCGVCAAACPSSAMDQKHFRDEFVLAEIAGVI
jgi:heterodisulfide reductase subunit A